MKLRIYQVDAFTHQLFKGNPAAVIPLQDWLPDSVMQQIALENNLSETAFFVPAKDYFELRWFTPQTEVNLCGHATLATAHVLFTYLFPDLKEIQFSSKSGILIVYREEDTYYLDFPTSRVVSVQDSKLTFAKRMFTNPVAVLEGNEDLMVVLPSEEEVICYHPDFQHLSKLDYRGIIITAKGSEADFVSRFFGPRVGVNEDPVTGSAHTLLIPYWSAILKKNKMTARQLSIRGGELFCEHKGERVRIGGSAVTYLTGEILIPGD